MAGLPAEYELRKSLTGKPVTSVRLLMDRIDKYRRIKDDQLQGKGKAKVIPQERRDSRSDRLQNNRPQRDFQGNLHLPTPRRSTLCFGNQCRKSWRK